MFRIFLTTLCACFVVGGLSAQNRAVFGPPIVSPPCIQGVPQQVGESQFKYVCFDLQSGSYVANYPRSLVTGDSSHTDSVELRIELRNLGDPKIQVDVARPDVSGPLLYSYEVENGLTGTRPIESWAIVTSGDDDSVALAHPQWRKTRQVSSNPVVAPQAALSDGPVLRRSATMGRFARWSTSLDEDPIPVGGKLNGFELTSDFLPGWTTAYVAAGEGVRLPDGVPGAVRDEIAVLARPEVKNSLVLTVGPKFAPDAAVQWIAADWHLGVQKLVVRGLLSDESSYVQELLAALAIAAEAASPTEISVKAKPETPEEQQIDRIVRLALGNS